MWIPFRKKIEDFVYELTQRRFYQLWDSRNRDPGLSASTDMVQMLKPPSRLDHIANRLIRFGELRYVQGDVFRAYNREGAWSIVLTDAHARPKANLSNGRIVIPLGLELLGSEGIPASAIIKEFGPDYEVIEWANLG